MIPICTLLFLTLGVNVRDYTTEQVKGNSPSSQSPQRVAQRGLTTVYSTSSSSNMSSSKP